MENDILKKVEELEKRIKELESLKKENFNMFGKSYHLIGETSSDFLIKTRGQVKIQYGGSFIDLIKNGKINVDSKFIFKENSVGSKDGIYVVDNGVYLVVNGQQILLKGEIGITYVSFLANQDTTSEQKNIALLNIGLVVPTKDDININYGIVYVLEDNKLYIVNDGIVSLFNAELPNPYPNQITIAKNDLKKGALVIEGNTIYNSIAFNSFWIYSENGIACFVAKDEIDFKINDDVILSLKENKLTCNRKFITDSIESKDASRTTGYRLYMEGGESTLEVDNLIVRNDSKNYPLISDYWYTVANVIKSADVDDDFRNLEITLNLGNNFNKDDILLLIIRNIEKTDQDTEGSLDIVSPKYIKLTVTSSEENKIRALSELELSDEDISLLPGKILYRLNIEDSIRIRENNLDIVKYEDIIKLRIGDLTKLNKEIIDNSSGNLKIEKSGIYSSKGLFDEAAYTSDYILEDSDDSSRFASTEWVKKNTVSKSGSSSLSMPVGSIIMFDNSYDIPDGWEIYENSNKPSEINTLSLNNISENNSKSLNNLLIFIRKKY